MEFKVLAKQNNSKMCFLCGTENKFGFKGKFYECEDNVLVGVYNGIEEHQSYPGRMHGGICGAILDEAIGRARQIGDPDIWGVTIKLETRYRKPTPIGETIYSVSRITKSTDRMFEGEGTIYDKNGNVLVTASASYLALPAHKISKNMTDHSVWFYVDEKLPTTIKIG